MAQQRTNESEQEGCHTGVPQLHRTEAVLNLDLDPEPDHWLGCCPQAAESLVRSLFLFLERDRCCRPSPPSEPCYCCSCRSSSPTHLLCCCPHNCYNYCYCWGSFGLGIILHHPWHRSCCKQSQQQLKSQKQQKPQWCRGWHPLPQR